MGDPREVDFEKYEDFYEFFADCIRSIKESEGRRISLKEIAFRLGLTQSKLSQRLSACSDNSPRFGLNDLVLYMVTFNDWRPVEYLLWYKKNYEEDRAKGNGKELRHMRKQVQWILSKIDDLIRVTDIEK